MLMDAKSHILIFELTALMQVRFIVNFHTEVIQLIVTRLVLFVISCCWSLRVEQVMQRPHEGDTLSDFTTSPLPRGDGCIRPETAYLTFWCLSPSTVSVLLNDFALSNKRRCDWLQ